jgi:hypothetical protein
MLLHAEVYHDFLPKANGRPRRRKEWRTDADIEISAEDRARNPFLCSDELVQSMIDALETTSACFAAQSRPLGMMIDQIASRGCFSWIGT